MPKKVQDRYGYVGILLLRLTPQSTPLLREPLCCVQVLKSNRMVIVTERCECIKGQAFKTTATPLRIVLFKIEVIISEHKGPCKD